MNLGVIKRIKGVESSLKELEEISKRCGCGFLDDLSVWWSNQSLMRELVIAQMDNDTPNADMQIIKVDMKLHAVMVGLNEENWDVSLSRVSLFIRNDLEDCILGLQQAIQILEEAQNNE